MAQLRHVLAPFTAIWLFCQIGAVASAPLAVWISTTDRHLAECTCGHGDGAMCPMHHKPAGKSSPCALQAANGSATAVLTTFVVMVGFIAEPTPSILAANPSKHSLAADVNLTGECPVPPDPPPPRI